MAGKTRLRKGFRTETDSLGPVRVPAGAYYGAQTQRAVDNFPVSGLKARPGLVRATAMVKYASAAANLTLKKLDKRRASAIMRASEEIIAGGLADQFVVDVFQAGAGTSHNMNANEVIANRAIELLGGVLGDYSLVHPNDHVNMSQSTNDTFPTAMRLAALEASSALLVELKALNRALKKKARQFDGVIKSGRTHLQDAVPVRLGSELGSYASAIGAADKRVSSAREGLKRTGLGATAAGTGMNTHPGYRARVLAELKRISGQRGLKAAPDTFEALNSMADFSAFSGALKDLAVECIRIANDLRLLSSGPHTGLAEVRLPAVQPGSSIMPGKVNPVMAEMLDMVAFQVIGNDLAVTMAAQAGQLELNVMGPVIIHNLLGSLDILAGGIRAFTERCVAGLTADRDRCKAYFESSVGLATVLNQLVGYEAAAAVAKEAAATRRSIREVVLEKGLLSEREWARLMAPEVVTGPTDLKGLQIKGPKKR